MKARQYAYEVLQRVFLEGGYASLIMQNNDSVDERSMPFVSEVVYGTIRNTDLLSFQWKDLVRGKVKKKTAVLLNMSVYQLFFMKGEAAYAVVNEAVEMAGRKQAGFVNAILHQVVSRGLQEPENFAIRVSHPQWILDMWRAHYGEETMRKIAGADQERPLVFGRVNTLKAEPESLKKKSEYHFLNDLSFTYDGVIAKSEDFQHGNIVIQDLHSAEVIRHLDLKPGMKVLDACAAPGTKCQEMAMFMQNEGSITACDLYPQRTHLIDELMAKTGTKIVRTETADASILRKEELYDRILCDVPCSGLGDLRHKPEIRFHIQPENIDALVETQRKILEASTESLKEDGMIMYSTCTLNHKENEGQVHAFVGKHPDFQIVEERTFFPFEDHADGFYYALLRRSVEKL